MLQAQAEAYRQELKVVNPIVCCMMAGGTGPKLNDIAVVVNQQLLSGSGKMTIQVAQE